MKHLLFRAFGAALVLASATAAIAAEQAGDPQAGFEYAHTYCATCPPNIIVAPKDMLNVIAYIVSLKGREADRP